MQPPLFVVQMETSFSSLEEAQKQAPDKLAAHVARCREWYADGRLLLAGAVLDRPDESVQTMAVLRDREDAEEFAAGDPFVVAGMVRSQVVRPWANLLGA